MSTRDRNTIIILRKAVEQLKAEKEKLIQELTNAITGHQERADYHFNKGYHIGYLEGGKKGAELLLKVTQFDPSPQIYHTTDGIVDAVVDINEIKTPE